jgi:hypothetical protein
MSPSGGSPGILGDIFNFLGAGRAAGAVSDAAVAAEHGVLGANQTAAGMVNDTLNRNSNAVIGAQGQAIGDVSNYGNIALNSLGGNLGTAEGNINPFIGAGQAGVGALQNYAQSNPQFDANTFAPQQGQYQAAVGNLGNFVGNQSQNPFSFAPTMQQLAATPGYQFARQEGLNAIQNQNSASGLGNSSNQNLDAAKFATGLASQTYQNEFQNALNTYNTNEQAGLANTTAAVGAAGGLYNSAFNNSLNAFGENQNVTARNLGLLTNAGLTGTGQANQALLGFGLPAAQDIYNTGLFGGNTINSNALFNAAQGLQGTEFQGNLLQNAAQQAGGFALEGAGANAQGILSQYNNLAGAGSTALQAVVPFL